MQGFPNYMMGGMMINTDSVACEHCQKVFESHTELEHLYCGHNQVLAFRSSEGYVDYVPVTSTEEAIQILHDLDQLIVPMAISA